MIYCSWVMKMPMKYDKLFELMKTKKKNNGVTTWSLRHYEEAGLPNGVGEATIQRLRKGEPVRMDVFMQIMLSVKVPTGGYYGICTGRRGREKMNAEEKNYME